MKYLPITGKYIQAVPISGNMRIDGMSSNGFADARDASLSLTVSFPEAAVAANLTSFNLMFCDFSSLFAFGKVLLKIRGPNMVFTL